MAYSMITASELKERLDSGADLLIIDTLVPEHYEDIHIPGAKLACVYEVNFMDRIAELAPDKTTPMVLYGSSPRTHSAFAAVEKLERAGIQRPVRADRRPGGLARSRIRPKRG